MADFIVVADIPPWDGRYELDLNGRPLTFGELHWVKVYAGYLPLELDGRAFGDPDVIATLAIVALHRAGKIEDADVAGLWERLQDVPFGTAIRYEFGAVEDGDDAGPPPESSNGNESSSGESSPTGSESPAGHPSRTGHPASAISGSAPATSAG